MIAILVLLGIVVAFAMIKTLQEAAIRSRPLDHLPNLLVKRPLGDILDFAPRPNVRYETLPGGVQADVDAAKLRYLDEQFALFRAYNLEVEREIDAFRRRMESVRHEFEQVAYDLRRKAASQDGNT